MQADDGDEKAVLEGKMIQRNWTNFWWKQKKIRRMIKIVFIKMIYKGPYAWSLKSTLLPSDTIFFNTVSFLSYLFLYILYINLTWPDRKSKMKFKALEIIHLL